MYGIVLIAALIVTGGAIAVIGDRVGSKVGKKKLSLFGLRPRHTSVIVTIVTGVLITTLTFAVLAAASENVRVALFGMEKLNEEMHSDIQKKNEKINNLNSQIDDIQKSISRNERFIENVQKITE